MSVSKPEGIEVLISNFETWPLAVRAVRSIVADAASLAACLATLATDPIRAAVMGDAARIRAGQFSLERTVEGVALAVARVAR